MLKGLMELQNHYLKFFYLNLYYMFSITIESPYAPHPQQSPHCCPRPWVLLPLLLPIFIVNFMSMSSHPWFSGISHLKSLGKVWTTVIVNKNMLFHVLFSILRCSFWGDINCLKCVKVFSDPLPNLGSKFLSGTLEHHSLQWRRWGLYLSFVS